MRTKAAKRLREIAHGLDHTRGVAAAARAIERTMGTPAWARSLFDEDERGWLLLAELCSSLHPLGLFTLPPVGKLRRDSERRIRDAAIVRDFDGGNWRQLATRYRLSSRQVRRIVAEADSIGRLGDDGA